MKSIIYTSVFFILLQVFTSCENPSSLLSDKISETKVQEFLKIYIDKDTSNYMTSVIESNNPEAPDVLVMQFRFKIMQLTQEYDTKDSVNLVKFEIIENPYKEEAQFSIDYEGNQNGLYSEDGKKLEFPLLLKPYLAVNGILKHGQTIDKATLDFIKSKFSDLNNIKSNEVFQALRENGLNLCNDKVLTEQIFQLNFYSERGNLFTRDVWYPYNNYCQK
ncbi:MAG: hypothetical protein ABIJ97_05595 [Bacteroidota bacterium]